MRAIVTALAVLTTSTAAAQITPSRDTTGPVIVVSGEGKSLRPPDQLIVQLGVETRARTASKAGTDNAERMTAVRRALLGLGLTEREISTAYYNVRMEMHGQTGRDTLYVASNSVQVETAKLSLVSRIIDTALQAGANNIAMVQYTLANSRDAKRAALAAAVEDARSQAESLAAAAGGRLGELQELNAVSQRVIPYMANEVAMARMQAAETPISSRDIPVYASITARWRFVPGR
jgi:uncharacterized protein YggE